ncbi:TPA: replication endonuclease [Vibrio parahaemolyticus]|nr:replication endonuclease [Vibrio parahaemolyticus]
MFCLPYSINHLFDATLKEVKKIGHHLSVSANSLYIKNERQYVTKAEIFSLFQHTAHAQFFFYNYDIYFHTTQKLIKLEYKLSMTSARAIKKRETLQHKIVQLNHRIKELEVDAHKRLMNQDYCKRKITKLVMSEMLYSAQCKKTIGAKSTAYAPNTLVKFRKLQKQYNAEILANRFIMVKGGKISLASFISTTDKKISELYAKVKGFETIANEHDMEWAFITITAPARYHPNPSKPSRTGWNNKSALAAHEELKSYWNAFRKSLSKKGIAMDSGQFFGMRITEPHKDGCPHWHLLCFFQPELKDLLFHEKEGLLPKKFSHSKSAVKTVFGKMDTLGSEGVASAATYCFKYLTKSLGGDMDEVVTANIEQKPDKSIDGIERIEAWRAATGIRAYQLFGMKGLSNVWNSIRKISSQIPSVKVSFNQEGKKEYSIFESPLGADNYQQILEHAVNSDSVFEKSLEQYDALDEKEKALFDGQLEAAFANIDPDLLNLPSVTGSKKEKELMLSIELNDYSDGFVSAYENDYKFTTLLKHAIDGNWADFYTSYDELTSRRNDEDIPPISLVYEEYTNKYNERKRKVIGVNTGLWVYLFKKYTITSE